MNTPTATPAPLPFTQLSLPPAIIVAVILFVIGTLISARAEERLLRTAFGGEYDAYASTTPALWPWRPRR